MGKNNSTISGKVSDGNLTFNFVEVKNGNNREIKISLEGTANSEHTYGIDPDPHRNPAYNKKNQTKFYVAAATNIATYYDNNEAAFPPANGTQTFSFKNFDHALIQSTRG